jgi:hypothetical protein
MKHFLPFIALLACSSALSFKVSGEDISASGWRLAGCVIPYGKGEIVFYSLPQLVTSLQPGNFTRPIRPSPNACSATPFGPHLKRLNQIKSKCGAAIRH